MAGRAEFARATLVLASVVLAVLLATPAQPQAQPACACASMTFTTLVGNVPRQPLSPARGDVGEVRALFESATSRLASVMRRFVPETWGQGRVGLTVLGAQPERRPHVHLDVDLHPGPAHVRGAAIVPVHACRATCAGGAEGRRIVLDLRGANGELRGVVDALAFDLCLHPDPRPGWASLGTTVRIARGPRFPSGLVRLRARQLEAFFSAQGHPLLAAVRSEYRQLRRAALR